MQTIFAALASVLISSPSAHAQVDLQTANQKVAQFLETTDLARMRTYCVPGKDDCRTLVQRKDKITGELSPSFYDIFSTRERKTFSVCFVLFNEETKAYEVFSDLTPDGEIKIDQILAANNSVAVTFDAGKYPTAHNIVLSKLGSDAGIKGVMSFSQGHSFVEGSQIKLAKPEELGSKVRIEYAPIPVNL